VAEEPEGQAAEPDEQDVLDALARLNVGDWLAQTLVTITSLGFARLEPGARDLAQVRLAIEALRALVPVLEGAVDEALLRDLEGARSSLQLAYAKVVAEDRPDDGGADS
jgi:hypothetical protein